MNFNEYITNLCPKTFRLPLRYHYSKFRGKLEGEVVLLEELVGKGKRAIDIGAHKGLYVYALSKLFSNVEAFEPQPWGAETVLEYKNKNCNINVYNIALSDSKGSLNLHIPISGKKLMTGRASLREIEGEHKSITVPIHCLDDYNFKEVSFIKIDVEGHETKVIKGGRETILREKPVILIEIEQRHLGSQTIEAVFNEITTLGYQGSFLKKGKFVPLSEFSYERDQEPFVKHSHCEGFGNNEDYVNNFIFRPIQHH